jgi:ABC-type microcin C transport system duplicated ATPase subunit YejF
MSLISSANKLNALRASKELLEVTMKYYSLNPLMTIDELIKDKYIRKHRELQKKYVRYKRKCLKNPIIILISY